MLVNLQPISMPMKVEVFLADSCYPAGTAQDSANKLDDMRAALRTLTELSGTGLFSLRAETTWKFKSQFSSSAAWALASSTSRGPECS